MSEAQIKITARDDASKVLGVVQRELANTERNAALLGSAFNGITGGLLATASVAGFVAFAKTVNSGVDAMNDLKDATGASIENISALEDVGARTGTSFESMSSSLIKFNKSLTTAKDGNEAGQVFKALGLDVERLKQIDPAEALRQTAVALANFSDNGEKARAVQELFGKSVAQAAPFLKDLSEQTQLHGTVTEAAALEAEKFNKILFEGQKNALDLSRTLVGPVIEGLNAITAEFRKAAKEGDGFFATLFKNTELYRLFSGKDFVIQSYESMNKELALVNGALAQANISEQRRNGLLAQREKLMQRMAAAPLDTRAEDARFARSAIKPDLKVGGGEKDAKAVKEKASAYESLNKRIADQIALLGLEAEKGRELSDVEKFVAKVREDAAQSATPLTQQEIKSLDEKIARYKTLSEVTAQQRRNLIVLNESAAAYAKAYEDEQREIDQAQKAREQADVRASKSAYDLIKAAKEESGLLGLSNEQRSKAVAMRQLEATGIDKTTEAYQRYRKELEDEIDKQQAFAKQQEQIKSVEDDLLDLATNGKDAWKRMVDNMLKEFLRMKVIRPMLEDAFGFKVQGGSSGGGGLFENLGQLFGRGFSGGFPGLTGPSGGFGTGNAFGNLDLGGFFADGGSPPLGKISVVGERGPELFVPRSAGTIVPNEALGGGTVFSPVTHITISGGNDQQGTARLIGQAIKANNEAWRTELRAARVI